METNSPDRVLAPGDRFTLASVNAVNPITPLEFIREKLKTDTPQEKMDQVRWVALDGDTPLDAIGLDSLELLSLQLDCEKEFGKQFSAEEYGRMRTIGDLARAFN